MKKKLKDLLEIKVHKPGLPPFPIEIDSKETFDRISKLLNSRGYTYLDGSKLGGLKGEGYPDYLFDEGNKQVSEWVYVDDEEMNLNEIKVHTPGSMTYYMDEVDDKSLVVPFGSGIRTVVYFGIDGNDLYAMGLDHSFFNPFFKTLDQKGIPYKIEDNRNKIIIPNYKKYFREVEKLNEIKVNVPGISFPFRPKTIEQLNHFIKYVIANNYTWFDGSKIDPSHFWDKIENYEGWSISKIYNTKKIHYKQERGLNEIKVHKPGLPSFPIELNKYEYDKIAPTLDKAGYVWYGNLRKSSKWSPWTTPEDIDIDDENKILLSSDRDKKLSWKRKERLNEIKVHKPGLSFPLFIEDEKTYLKWAEVLDKAGYIWLDGEKLVDWHPNPFPYYLKNTYYNNIEGKGTNFISWGWKINEIKVHEPGLPRFPVLVQNKEEYLKLAVKLEKAGHKWLSGSLPTAMSPLYFPSYVGFKDGFLVWSRDIKWFSLYEGHHGVSDSYNLDGTIQKVITTFNDAASLSMEGGFMKLNVGDFEFDRHGSIRSNNNNFGASNNLGFEDESIIQNALERIGFSVEVDKDGLVFLPIDSINEIKVHNPVVTIDMVIDFFNSSGLEVDYDKFNYVIKKHGYVYEKWQGEHPFPLRAWAKSLKPSELKSLYYDLLTTKKINEIKVNKPGLPNFPIKINSEEEWHKIAKVLEQKGYKWANGIKPTSWMIGIGAEVDYPYYITQLDYQIKDKYFGWQRAPSLNEIKVNRPGINANNVLQLIDITMNDHHHDEVIEIMRTYGYSEFGHLKINEFFDSLESSELRDLYNDLKKINNSFLDEIKVNKPGTPIFESNEELYNWMVVNPNNQALIVDECVKHLATQDWWNDEGEEWTNRTHQLWKESKPYYGKLRNTGNEILITDYEDNVIVLSIDRTELEEWYRENRIKTLNINKNNIYAVFD